MTKSILSAGKFDARYSGFIETVAGHRAQLHRYCSRMTGSVLDGEDVMQDVLFEAYRKLDYLEDGQDIGRWLFRIAHNRCIRPHHHMTAMQRRIWYSTERWSVNSSICFWVPMEILLARWLPTSTDYRRSISKLAETNVCLTTVVYLRTELRRLG